MSDRPPPLDAPLDALLADAEAGVRTPPPAETAAVRTMCKRVGLDPTKTRPFTWLCRRKSALCRG